MENKKNKTISIIITILIIILICIFIALWQLYKSDKIQELYDSKEYAKAYNLSNNGWFLFKDDNLFYKVKIMHTITQNYENGETALKRMDTTNTELKKTFKNQAGNYFLNVIVTAISYEEMLDNLNIRNEVISLRDSASNIFLKELKFDLEKALKSKETFDFYPLNKEKIPEEINEVINIAQNSEIKDKFKKYINENNIELTAKEVQYNMQNNLDKEFILEGTAKLDDYYNYGYNKSIENSYFCISITPNNSTYSDIWYIYCKRNQFSYIYNQLLIKKQNLNLICKIEKGKFQKNQGNMATAVFMQIK